jgi:hypothetical protein
MHDTPSSSLSGEAVGLGLDTPDQAVPFHNSTSVWSSLLEVPPTATQSEELMHDTAERVPSTSGLGIADQVVPFHDSARGCVEVPPTATQSEELMHDTV